MEIRDDLAQVLLDGLSADEREQTVRAIKAEDARQLRRAQRGAASIPEQAESTDDELDDSEADPQDA